MAKLRKYNIISLKAHCYIYESRATEEEAWRRESCENELPQLLQKACWKQKARSAAAENVPTCGHQRKEEGRRNCSWRLWRKAEEGRENMAPSHRNRKEIWREEKRQLFLEMKEISAEMGLLTRCNENMKCVARNEMYNRENREIERKKKYESYMKCEEEASNLSNAISLESMKMLWNIHQWREIYQRNTKWNRSK